MPVADPLIQPVLNPTLCIVTRDFRADVQRFRGEVVDTAEWSNVSVLIDRRYLSPLPYGFDLKTTIKVSALNDERTFVNKETADIATGSVTAFPVPAVTNDEPEPEPTAKDTTPPVREQPKRVANKTTAKKEQDS
jgi:hypothetical protein